MNTKIQFWYLVIFFIFLVVLNCGEQSSENSTYFQSTGSDKGACNAKICPMTSEICQLRLDFITFNIAEPSTSTVTIAKSIQGIPLGNILCIMNI